MLIVPTWTLFNIIFYIGLGVLTISLPYSDYHGLWTLQYSKFVKGDGIPSRTAMFILYFLPVVTATVTAWSYLFSGSFIQLIVYGSVSIHFAKRVLETLFLHKYSGKMAVQTLIFITFIYSLITGMICYLNTRTVPEMDTLFHIGVVLFFVGEAGNFYHHNLLADLRKGSEGYHIPQGGLFQYAACPHYFWSWFRGWVSYFCLVICLLFWH